MNARADNINGLVELQMMFRFSPKLAQRVQQFVDRKSNLPFQVKWEDERHAKVQVGKDTYPGLLLDLPTVNETYKMASKSRLFKSGDVGQMLIVYDPSDAEETAFFESQRYDPISWTLLSGVTPPSTYSWSRIFRKQNKPPKIDFAKVEQDLGDVNIVGKEDVEMDFIHPKELETLFLKPGQTLIVDGAEVEPIEGKSVGEIIKTRRMEKAEELKRQILEEKRLRKEAKKKRKLEGGGAAEVNPQQQQQQQAAQQEENGAPQQPKPDWQVAAEQMQANK